MDSKRQKKDKYKKSKKLKKEKEPSSSESSSSSEAEWTEAPSSSSKPKREDWMEEESFVSTYCKSDLVSRSSQRKQKAEEAALRDKKILEARELNPFMRKDADASTSTAGSESRPVGDGGYSWLKKAYERVKEQAEKEGRSMEEIAAERWGSLQKLKDMLKGAEERHFRSSSSERYEKYKKREQGSLTKYRDADRQKRLWRKELDPSKDYYYSEAKHSPKSPSYSSRESSSRFKAPREEVGDGHHHRSSGNSESISSSSSRNPLWMKKNFVKSSDTPPKSENSSKPPMELEKQDTFSKREEEVAQVAIEPKESHSETSSIEDDREEEDSKLPDDLVLNQNELNYLAARMLRARLEKDGELMARIKRELDDAQEKRADFLDSGEAVHDGAPRENVLEKKINSFPLPKSLKGKYHRGKKDKTVYVGPLRTSRYEDSSSLSHMFEREKSTTVDDQMKMYLDAASVSKESLDDECDADVSGKIAKKLNSQPNRERDMRDAIFDHKRRSKALEKCRFCLDQPSMLKHTIIAKGDYVYLCVPSCKSLVEGHCFIVPTAHVSSTLMMDENEYNEIQAYKRGLFKLFGDRGKCIVFMETSYKHKSLPHASIECIPMPKDTGELAPMYFKKAIDESEYEWAHNKKLIDLSKKGIRYSVPKALPFFSVEFGLQDGFAHVIEDERTFPYYFGKEIVGGMLEIDSHHIVKYQKETTQETCKKTLKFVDQWWKYKDYFTV